MSLIVDPAPYRDDAVTLPEAAERSHVALKHIGRVVRNGHLPVRTRDRDGATVIPYAVVGIWIRRGAPSAPWDAKDGYY